MRPIASVLNRFARTSFLLSSLAWIGPLVLYISTMRHAVDFWDTGEMQTVPWILGIAHPTGFPAFVLCGFLFSHLVPISTVAFRMTLYSAIAMSISAWLVSVAARELRVSAPIACSSAWLFACTNLAWSRGTRTEVHALAIAACAALMTLALRYLRLHDLRLLWIIAVIAGLGLAVHPVVVFALLPTGIIVAVGMLQDHVRLRRLTMPQVRSLVCAILGGLALGPLFYLYLPIRSWMLSSMHVDPTLALGVPQGRPYWDYGHPSTWDNFLRQVSGSDFSVGGGFAAMLNPASYFHIPAAFLAPTAADVGMSAMICAGIGVCTLARRIPWPAAIGLVGGGLFAVVFATSYKSESDVARYYLIALWIFALCVGLGIQMIVEFIVNNPKQLPRQSRIEYLGALMLFVGVYQTYTHNGPNFWNQPLDRGAEPFIERVLAQTPDNAVIIAAWPYATPLAYASYVDKSMGNRIIETAWPAQDLQYFPQWLRQRPIVIVEFGPPLPTILHTTPIDEGSPRLLRVDSVSVTP